ncbi:MAG: thioredoxin family protein [Planctomycetes bacterium]|nr:thioredoxin family protein [Planctomycetota bacterium]
MRKFSVLSVVALVTVLFLQLDAAAAKLSVGDKAPDFKATNVDGKEMSLDSVKDAKVVVIAFSCNKCPVAVAYEDRFIDFTKKYTDKGVKFIALNVNFNEDLDMMKQRAEEKDFNFPYAYDQSAESYKAYGALYTPHLYVLDGDRKVAYIGAFDDKMNVTEVTKHYVADAVDAILAGKKPETAETKAFGCTIKRPAGEK